MPKLFAVLLGGRAKGCNVELHDVVFIIGESLEDTYPRLVNKWFGQLHRSLHIDASVELKYIDGYEIILSRQRSGDNVEKSLYFTNFGGYQPGFFGEIHEMNFYVAASKSEVVAKAKLELCQGLHLQHCDDNLPVDFLMNETGLEVDDICVVDKVDEYFIHLAPTTHSHELNIHAHYRKLNLPDIIEKANELKEKMTLIPSPLAGEG
jgi:hypothetical protein